jgi:hypothetical protein
VLIRAGLPNTTAFCGSPNSSWEFFYSVGIGSVHDTDVTVEVNIVLRG